MLVNQRTVHIYILLIFWSISIEMASVVRFEFRWIFDRFSNKWSYFSYSLIHHNHVTHNVCIMATDRFTHCDQWSYCTDFVSWTMTFIHTCMHLVQTKHFAVAVLCLCVCVWVCFLLFICFTSVVQCENAQFSSLNSTHLMIGESKLNVWLWLLKFVSFWMPDFKQVI